jgi:AbiEi antitoxin C-terminal domain
MGGPFLGSEALADGRVTRNALRRQFVSLYPDVYVPRNVAVTAKVRAKACWLWSRRRGVLAGLSASALHRSKWIDAGSPAEIIYDNRRPPAGIRTYADLIGEDEIGLIDGIRVTTPARTALDLACRHPLDEAVAAVDSLAHATRVKAADVEVLAQRYRGRRGIKRARACLALADGGAQSPKETWLRLLLIKAGFPRPRTQIPVYDAFGQLIACLDMGWEDIRVAAEYDGDHHWKSRWQFSGDIHRIEALNELGWLVVRVTATDTEGGIVGRVAAARARRV